MCACVCLWCSACRTRTQMHTPTSHTPTNAHRECKAEVTRDANRAANDYRLNWRLKRACEGDIAALCAGLCPANTSAPCGGLVLHCLSERADNITATECQEVRPVPLFQVACRRRRLRAAAPPQPHCLNSFPSK